MKCEQCRACIPNDARFCCYCGAEILEKTKQNAEITEKLDRILRILGAEHVESLVWPPAPTFAVNAEKALKTPVAPIVPGNKTDKHASISDENIQKGYYVQNGTLLFCFDKNVEKITLELNDDVVNAPGLKIYKKLRRVVISGNIRRIPAGLFDGCSSVTSVDLSGSRIDQLWFGDLNGTKLHRLELPSCFSVIGNRTFCYCLENTKYLSTIRCDHFFEISLDAMPQTLIDREMFDINGRLYSAAQVNMRYYDIGFSSESITRS